MYLDSIYIVTLNKNLLCFKLCVLLAEQSIFFICGVTSYFDQLIFKSFYAIFFFY